MDITIVIPVLNRRALIRRTLESIIHSPVWPVQLIVVDNGSTDGTLEVLQQYAIEHREISVLQEPQRSAAAARNCGLAAVSTTWVYFFDSDDIFENLPQTWNSNADLVLFPTRQKIDGREKVRAFKPVADPHVHILNGMLNTICMIFRTSWLKELGGWNRNCLVWDDWELGLRALLASPVIQWITDRSYHHAIIHNDSISGPDFHSRYKKQLDCMEIAMSDCSDSLHPDKGKCLMALQYRIYILSGKLLYEGDRKASAQCHDFVRRNASSLGRVTLLSRLLEFYSSLGGRGAWRLALLSLDRHRKK